MTSSLQKALESFYKAPIQASGPIEMALLEAMEHVAKQARGSSIKTINLLMIGGASLHLAGLRQNFSDIDLLIDNIELSTRMEQKLLKCKNAGMSVELFYDNKISAVQDSRMFARAIPLDSMNIHGVQVNVGMYPPEYFLLMKMEMGRDKCQNDIQKMLMSIPMPALSEAFNELSRCNESWVMNDIADMMMTDLIMLNLPGGAQDSLTPLKELAMSLNVDKDKKRELLMMCKHIELQVKAKKRPTSELENAMGA